MTSERANCSNTKLLDEHLDQLRMSAAPLYHDWKRCNEKLWRQLAEAYVWWRSAYSNGDYLEARYAEKGIKWHSRRSR